MEESVAIKGKDIDKIGKNIKINKNELDSKRNTKLAKRVMDIGLSTIGLIVAAPIITVTAIAMKLEEPKGPIFFSQTRVGENENEFKIFKVRSMCVDAEDKLEYLLKQNEVDGAMFKMKEDPRVTKVGRFIRKTSIDELPQLWNVLKGDMSLVGPRPPLPREVEKYTTYDKQRLLVKPGCTGLWQVSGRNEMGFDEMVELDLHYINNLSLTNDSKIILKTVGVILKPNGAY
ncbi:UDP-phosphate galactose phosphotransferase [Floricoccus tropicus]|uniref:UDP-phosphate galactose phosphotransferase n=1 Tax=Floricoccus tropicus TaxID=1859473 RepID=A0A1E8GK14_9LACT|nr:sugar transferase [Floricoccus tropicus]OFI48590.1 UDP-phosphate galactose phosphotransferase [Floricoccus tropicus]